MHACHVVLGHALSPFVPAEAGTQSSRGWRAWPLGPRLRGDERREGRQSNIQTSGLLPLVIPAERAAQVTGPGPVSLRHGHQLEHVAVRVLEIDSAAAAPVVELAVVEAP